VFQLVPPVFDNKANLLYAALGRPEVRFETFWDVYRDLLAQFENLVDADVSLSEILNAHEQTTRSLHDDEMTIIPGQKALRNGGKVIGDSIVQVVAGDSESSVQVAGPSSQNMEPAGVLCAIFTDDEDSEEGSDSEGEITN
jgi:hypothetical protein